MFYPLAADTVFEARRRALFRTRLLLALLCAIYAAGFNLIAAGLYISESPRGPAPGGLWLWTTLAAFAVAAAHMAWARSKTLDAILTHLGARPADASDEAHRRFINLVEEASVAVNRPGIRPAVIGTTALNAFSVEGAGGECAIGVTEGLLAQLTRPELESVVAHEAAHLAHGDSRLLATACSLFSIFDILSRMRVRGRGRAAGAAVFVWLVAVCGRLLSQLVYLALSRNREYYADSEAVHLCKNPLALAGALKKISTRDRGYMAVPEGFSAMFIFNPALRALDEAQGLAADWLSTHPPADARIERLMKWAQKDAPEAAETPAGRPVFIHQDDAWSGPVEAQTARGLPLDPQTWVSDGGAIMPAVAHPVLGAVFHGPMGGKTTGRSCPRCTTPLMEEIYEGVGLERCSWCRGRLLPEGGLMRSIVRRQAPFSSPQLEEVKRWRAMQRGSVGELCRLPHIRCPRCQSPMMKRFHTEVTRVVVDACTRAGCEAVWCDSGELEKIQMIIESHGST